MANIGSQLKEYFTSQGITQVEIAEKLGVSKAYVNGVFNNKNTLGKAAAVKWSSLFGLNPAWLLTGEGDMLKTPTTQINQTNNGTMAVGINNGTAHIPSPSPPTTDQLYHMCLEMTREAKETHQMAVDVLKKATDMLAIAYGVNDAIKTDRENVQNLFRDLREARDRHVAENTKFLVEQKIAFNEWVDEQKKHVDAICAEFAEMIHAQTRETERNVNASTEKIVHASTKKIVETCRTMDLTDIRKDLNSILIHYEMSRGAETTSGNA